MGEENGKLLQLIGELVVTSRDLNSTLVQLQTELQAKTHELENLYLLLDEKDAAIEKLEQAANFKAPTQAQEQVQVPQFMQSNVNEVEDESGYSIIAGQ